MKRSFFQAAVTKLIDEQKNSAEEKGETLE